MRKILFFAASIFVMQASYSQVIQVRVVQTGFSSLDPDGAGPITGSVTFAFELKSTAGDVLADGMGLSVAYQSAFLKPLPADPLNPAVAKVGPINTGLWIQQVDNRVGNPINPDVMYGGRAFDRRMIITFNQTAGTPDALISGATWTRVATVTYHTLGTTTPQGGYIYVEPASVVAANELSSDGGGTTYPYELPAGAAPVALSLTNSPLPVEFTRFDVQCFGGGTTVRWNTASEKNNSHFEVEKSVDGTTWSSIGRVNSNSNHVYLFTDKVGGQAVYRVKQVDLNGAVSYTSLARSTCNNRSFVVGLYPIPAKDKLTLTVNSDRTLQTTAQLVDNYGRLMMNISLNIVKGTNTFTLNVGHLAQGQYYLRSNESGAEINQRFTITR